jgi:hypothetical protein
MSDGDTRRLLQDTHKPNFASIDERLRCEPLPHESASRPALDGVDETPDVVIH